MSNRSRKSKDFSIPGNPGAPAPPLPLSPVQAERLRELWLLHCFTTALLLHWRGGVDGVGTLRMVVAVGGPALNKNDVAAAFGDAENDEQGDDRLPTIAMLSEATRWYVGLQLPRTRLELWSGPPVRERQRPPTRQQPQAVISFKEDHP